MTTKIQPRSKRSATSGILLLALTATLFCTQTSIAYGDQVICVNNKSGKLAVRSKCKRGESKLSRESLRGPQGLPGRGVNEALAGGTGVRGVAGGVFAAPGTSGDPWSVVESFNAVLPTPLTSDKVIIAQKDLRRLCRDSRNSSTITFFLGNTANDCLRRTEPINATLFNQRDKTGQFSQNYTDNLCTGTSDAPTAPAGYLCIYLVDAQDFFLVHADTVPSGSGSDGFSLNWISAGSNNSGIDKSRVSFTWAYTAP
jgi:hypothetical protein